MVQFICADTALSSTATCTDTALSILLICTDTALSGTATCTDAEATATRKEGDRDTKHFLFPLNYCLIFTPQNELISTEHLTN